MKPLKLLFIIAFFLGACGTSTESTDETEAADAAPLASEYSYSNSFEMADPGNLAIVRNWNNAMEAGNVDEAFSYAADSLHLTFADGSDYNATGDSIKTIATQFLNEFSSVRVDYIAGLSVRSTDRGQTWVLSYTDETVTNSEGENRVIAHELYQIEDGKIRGIYAYAQVPSEADTPPEEDLGDGYGYSGSFEMGNPENVEVVESFLSALENEDLDEIGNYFADSTTLFFADGSMMNTTRDSTIASIKGYLEVMDLSLDMVAAMSARSIDRNEEWVLVWLDETSNSAEGESNVILHEAYMLQNGKIRVMRQFERKVIED